MNNVVTIRGFSMRHITATGGNGSQGGIPYNNLFVDCIGTGVATHAFDMHPACGTGNKYINCRASAGVAIADTANFQGEWASTVTYDNNDIISIYSSDTSGYQLYRSVQNSNTNHSPNTDLGAYWEVYDNAFNGFGILCSDVEIINCEVTGFSSGLLLNNRVHRNIKVDGLTINNGTYGVFLENDTVINSSFTNIYHKNEAFMDDAYTIVLSGSTLNSVDFDNIYSTNATAFLVQTSTITQKTLHCGNIFSDILLIAGIQSNEIHIDFDNVVNRAKSNPANCIYLPTTANGIKSINIDDWTVYNPVTAVIGNNAHINSLSIGNARLVDGNTVNFIDNNDSIDRIYIGYIYNDGSGALDILDNTGGYCSEFVVENMAGTLQAVPWLKGNAVATQFIKWGAAVDVIDFKAAGQYSGWIKQGGQTLINTYGSGNVGLGYKALTQQGALTYVGTANTAVGCESLWNLSITSGGTRNAAFGYNSGRAMSTGTDNTLHGAYAGRAISTGIGNTVIGSYAGYSLGAGSDYNVLIGFNAGYNETGSNKLYIDNTNTATPLIGGDFSTDAVTITGSCSITTFLKLTPTADPPASAAEGMIYADTDHHIYYYNGSRWVQLDN